MMHDAVLGPAPAGLSADNLERELAQLTRYGASRRLGKNRVEQVERYGFVVRPGSAPAQQDIDLLFMALTHGNESGGLLVMNALCALLEAGLVAPDVSVGFLACNVDAARRGTRQVERDLNRCFGQTDTASLEGRRAREIEPLMLRARHCVDLHQTIEPTLTPFFVLAYAPRSLRFAHGIFPGIPVVTYWGKPFSRGSGDGCTSYEFVQRHGGVPVSIELGQKGSSLYQTAFGLDLCLRAMAMVMALQHGGTLPDLSDELNPIYTWKDIVPYPSGQVMLRPGLRNFESVEAGQQLGVGAEGPVLASSSGYLLFPKYVSGQGPRPAELYRLLRRARLEELGRGDCLLSQAN